MTMNSSGEASLLAEAHDLVSDRALPCELCRRRMRYFPVRGQVTVRAFGPRLNWRCMQCVAGGHMMASLLSGDGIVPADSLKLWVGMAGDLLEQCEELSRAHTKRPRPLFAEALDRLYMQLQIAGEAIAEHADAVALRNVVRLSEHRAQRSSHAQSSAGARPEEANL